MAKRANGEGTIYKYREGFAGQVTIGRDAGTGKLKRKTFYGETQAEVRKHMAAAVAAIDTGTYTEPSKITVGQWLDIWHTECLASVKPNTVSQYGTQIKMHIKPSIGAVKLRDLKPIMIQKMYNDKVNGGLSAKSVRNIHGVLHHALERAIKYGYITANPCSACEPPKVIKKEMQFIPTEEIAGFITECNKHKYGNVYLVTMFTGMRRGEVLGLTWDCIDFERQKIKVNKQLVKERKREGKAEYNLSSTKTNQIRVIDAASTVFDVLREVRKKQLECRLRAGSLWENKQNFVFTNEVGHHLSADSVYECFKRLVARLGMSDLRFHDMRHTFATLSLQNGDDIKSVSGNLGHATASITLDVYGHLTDQMKRDSADRMEAFIQNVKPSI